MDYQPTRPRRILVVRWFEIDLASEIWASATRTLTQTSAAVTAAVSGATLTIHRGDTWSATLRAYLRIPATSQSTLRVKASPDDADDNAILRIRKNASTTERRADALEWRGCVVSPVVAADGSITVNSATSLTIALAARATDDLSPADNLYYDVQYVFAASVTTATNGQCDITADITRLIA